MDYTEVFHPPPQNYPFTSLLEQHPTIDHAYYYRQATSGSIIEFMNTCVPKSDIVIIFCTPKSKKAHGVSRERDMAILGNKIIIPIFESIDHVSPVIQMESGITIESKSTPQQIFDLIIKRIDSFRKYYEETPNVTTAPTIHKPVSSPVEPLKLPKPISQNQFRKLMIEKGVKMQNHFCTECGKKVVDQWYFGTMLTPKREEEYVFGVMSEIHGGKAICTRCFNKKYTGMYQEPYEIQVQRIKEKFNVQREPSLLDKLFKG
jgi:hypothetical protein